MEFTNLDQTDCSCFEDLPLPTIIVKPEKEAIFPGYKVRKFVSSQEFQ